MNDFSKLRRWRNWRQIVDAYHQNKSASEISKIFKITQEEVVNIITTIKEIEGK